MSELRKRVKDLEIGTRKKRNDIDPEDTAFGRQEANDDDTDSDDSVDEDAGREHYQAVGKSKLRKPEKTKLDEKRYGGQAVSRSQIFQDDDEADVLAPVESEDEDPFAANVEESSGSEDDQDIDNEDMLSGNGSGDDAGEDEEIESDEAFEEGEEATFRGKGFVFRGSGRDLKELPAEGDADNDDDEEEEESIDESGVSEEERSDLDMEDVEEDEESDGESFSDEDEDEEEDDEESTARPRPSTIRTTVTNDREKLKALISDETAALASSLSASLSADAKKGASVKQQYQTFDRLLDSRIKLQKGFTASNDLQIGVTTTDEAARIAIQKAEEAALKLYSTIESLRHTIIEANPAAAANEPKTQTGKKRKRATPPTTQTSSSELWSRITKVESSALPTRRQVLDKWSSKTRSAAPIPSSSSKLKDSSSQSESKLTSVLDAYLQSETPKILTASQSSQDPSSMIPVYDDSNFYQSLLRDLINSRSATAGVNGGASLSNANLPVVPLKLHASGNTSKNRKIDTKASKGRKVRYTVHEKLENFMASEGRGNTVGQWNDGAVREFFASLLGQRGMLGEDADDHVGDEMIDGEDQEMKEVEALRLFRT